MNSFTLVSGTTSFGTSFPDRLPQPARQFLNAPTRRLDPPAESVRLAWQPSYPDRHFPRRLPVASMVGASYFIAETGADPMGWVGTFPDRYPGRLPIVRPSAFIPPNPDILVAQSLAWLRPISQPRQVDHALKPCAFIPVPVPPVVGETCVELLGFSATVTELLEEAVNRSQLLQQAGAHSYLRTEDLC